MTIDESIRLAAVLASAVSVLVTISLFALREAIDGYRRRRRAATTLAMYAQIISRTLSRNSLVALPFGMKEVLDASQEVIHIPSVSVLVSEIENSLFAISTANLSRTPLLREDREKLLNSLHAALDKHISIQCLSQISVEKPLQLSSK